MRDNRKEVITWVEKLRGHVKEKDKTDKIKTGHIKKLTYLDNKRVAYFCTKYLMLWVCKVCKVHLHQEVCVIGAKLVQKLAVEFYTLHTLDECHVGDVAEMA